MCSYPRILFLRVRSFASFPRSFFQFLFFSVEARYQKKHCFWWNLQIIQPSCTHISSFDENRERNASPSFGMLLFASTTHNFSLLGQLFLFFFIFTKTSQTDEAIISFTRNRKTEREKQLTTHHMAMDPKDTQQREFMTCGF